MLTIVALVAIAIASVKPVTFTLATRTLAPCSAATRRRTKAWAAAATFRAPSATMATPSLSTISYRKREVEQTTRKVKVTVGFKYSRNDHSIDTRSTCGPEVRLLVNDQPIAHTEADPSAEDRPYF